MDAFSILSRSSAPRRKKSAGTNIPVPSAQHPQPQLFGTSTRQIANEEQASSGEKSRKRKRGHDILVETLPEELDFFGSAPQAAANGESVEDVRRRSEADTGDAEVDQTLEDQYVPDLSEEECRRILKDHKIKIARLDDAGEEKAAALLGSSGKRKVKSGMNNAEEKKKRKRTLDVIPQPLTTFEHLHPKHGINRQLAVNIRKQGYMTPTEVQLAALPLLLDGKDTTSRSKERVGVDVLTVAPTGSGKTLAFLIPVIDALSRSGRVSRPRAVIVSPTKELAIQTVHEAKKLCSGTGLKVALARKSMRLSDNEGSDGVEAASNSSEDEIVHKKLKYQVSLAASADIIVSTPLTLVKALSNGDGSIRPLSTVQHLILDEADVLLDALFRKQTLSVWNNCTHPDLRVSLWSATMGASIEELAQSTITSRIQRLPARDLPIIPNPAPLLRLVIGLKDSAIPHISHRLQYCGSESGKLLALRQLLRPGSNTTPSTSTNNANSTAATAPPLRPPFLIFTQTIPRARALHAELQYDIPASAGGPSRIAVLHADLTSRARMEIMARMRTGAIWVLITTDLLSRGVDFKGINGVVNYDFPGSSAGYVHRVGRTGRAGRGGGVAVTLFDRDDMPYLRNVVNVIAAAQRAKGAKGDAEEEVLREAGLEKWLLENLPKTKKRERQKLKKRGVESRRPEKVEGKQRGHTRNRIDTTSGYERRLENKRKGAVEGSKRRKMHGKDGQGGGVDDESFEVFD